MTAPESLSHWVTLLQHGPAATTADVWSSYFPRLAEVALPQLATIPLGTTSELDAALEGIAGFYRDIAAGRFDDLDGRDTLWRSLVVITRLKADGRLPQTLAQLQDADDGQLHDPTTDILAAEPTADFVVELLNEFQYLLRVLRQEDATLGLIAVRKAAGFADVEIAGELGLSVRTIERKLLRINILWAAASE